MKKINDKLFYLIVVGIGLLLLTGIYFSSRVHAKEIILGYKVPICINDGSCGYAYVPQVLAYNYVPNQNNFPINKVIGEAEPITMEYKE